MVRSVSIPTFREGPPLPTPTDVVEALLFASDTPLEAERIREVLELSDADEARALVDELRSRYDKEDRALAVVEVGGGYRMVTRPQIAPWLMRLAKTRTKARLSRPALETLAIIAYRQPVSRPEVDAVRGVNSEGVLDSLLERRLLRVAGRKEAPGRPVLYETTPELRLAFGPTRGSSRWAGSTWTSRAPWCSPTTAPSRTDCYIPATDSRGCTRRTSPAACGGPTSSGGDVA